MANGTVAAEVVGRPHAPPEPFASMSTIRNTAIRPIFVVGSSRAGTTMIGKWLASDAKTYDVGEYNAFYLTYRLIPEAMPGVQPESWAAHLDRYLADLQDHAADFIADVARTEGCDSYVDSSPRNIFIAQELADRFPEALFVLVLRHYSGVVQSLGRAGWHWVPPSVEGRARVWADAYSAAMRLPRDRTVAVSYDRVCAEPEVTLAAFALDLKSHGIRAHRLDRRVFGYSHAHVLGQPRTTLSDAQGRLAPIPSFDKARWTQTIHRSVHPHVRLVEERLRETFPTYSEPPDWSPPKDVWPSDPPLVDDTLMPQCLTLVAAEYVIEDLERVEELLVDLMGFKVAQRTTHPDFDADVVTLNIGAIALSLLYPTDVGDRPPFPLPEPRLAQLTFAVDNEATFEALRSRLVHGGVAVAQGKPRVFHLPQEFVQSVLGTSPIFVIVDTSTGDEET